MIRGSVAIKPNSTGSTSLTSNDDNLKRSISGTAANNVATISPSVVSWERSAP